MGERLVLRVCIYVYMYICIYVYMYKCIYVYMYICIYVYMYMYMYLYMHMYMYMYMYMCDDPKKTCGVGGHPTRSGVNMLLVDLTLNTELPNDSKDQLIGKNNLLQLKT